MAYNPYLPIGYNNYPQSIPQQQIIPTPATQQNQNTSLIWVQGEAGAKSYLVAPNSTVMLMDSESERFFLKSADASGMPAPLRIFEFKEVTGSAQATPATNTWICPGRDLQQCKTDGQHAADFWPPVSVC